MTFPLTSRRWNPWGDLLTLQDEMNKLFEGTLGSPIRSALFGTDFMPPVDVLRDKDNLVVRMDAPGMGKDDLDITILNDRLFVRGDKKEDTTQEGQNVHRRERFYGHFERVIDLPQPVEADKVKATFTDGVLQIVAPIRPEAKPKQITVDVK
jgi:HSP20 family protein